MTLYMLMKCYKLVIYKTFRNNSHFRRKYEKNNPPISERLNYNMQKTLY